MMVTFWFWLPSRKEEKGSIKGCLDDIDDDISAPEALLFVNYQLIINLSSGDLSFPT